MLNKVTSTPERRVFNIDVGHLTASEAEAFMEKIKDRFIKISSERKEKK